ncbi:LysR family transcriptional regulator [Burkholderia sp. Ac-20353]|uniref:LysR family transcriptional regulator n=1 Tax=Burkholderia sp. Ac-20353 TaxID=2703894 RepID=UPI00197BA860|nr:LysR family transcriptional regulator [Burkholderia sp. Ac-20353]MBN3787769.1 LysR family transcriptional regulator [Burkholderia sp. Ac-20353]
MKKVNLAQVTDFDLRLLRLFKTVAEHGSFVAAESALGITRSAISLHMSDLEKRLGMRLCRRGRGGFSLTDGGREVLRASESVLAAIENFRREINQFHQHLRGDLNIGIMNSLVTQPKMWITSALRMLRKKSDGVKVNISMSTPGEIERGLLDGQLHVGVLPLITTLSGLAYTSLYDERSLLYCCNGHPLFARHDRASADEIRNWAAVAPNYRQATKAIDLHKQLACAATASDREGIAFLIMTGEYIGFLPDHFAAEWVGKGMLRAIRPDLFHHDVTLALATRKGQHQNLIVDHFLDCVGAASRE